MGFRATYKGNTIRKGDKLNGALGTVTFDSVSSPSKINIRQGKSMYTVAASAYGVTVVGP
jgi:hypothetical protein